MGARRGASARAARQERARQRQPVSAGQSAEPQPKRPASEASPRYDRPPVFTTTREVLRYAEATGWRIRDIRDGWRLLGPGGEILTLHASISDTRAWRNVRSDFIRAEREAALRAQEKNTGELR